MAVRFLLLSFMLCGITSTGSVVTVQLLWRKSSRYGIEFIYSLSLNTFVGRRLHVLLAKYDLDNRLVYGAL
uniref:Secreted protein n=1 Tax=Pararge aegeria TaxID=116150 RepID=S4PNY5_9NEOP